MLSPHKSNSTSPIVVAKRILSLLLIPKQPTNVKSGTTPPRLAPVPTFTITTSLFNKFPDRAKLQVGLTVVLPLLYIFIL